MRKPQIGDLVRIVGEQASQDFEVGRVYATYDSITEWWDTASGENKVALQDALKIYGDEKAATATWYAEVEDATDDTNGTMAVASFECAPLMPFELAVQAVEDVYEFLSGEKMQRPQENSEYSFHDLFVEDDPIFSTVVMGRCVWEGMGGGDNIFVALLKQTLARDEEDWRVVHLTQYIEGNALIAEFDDEGKITRAE